MKVAIVTNGYPVGKSHMVRVLKQAGHDVVFIDIEAMPTFNGAEIDAVFVDEADNKILNNFYWDDTDYAKNSDIFKHVAQPDGEDLIHFEYNPSVYGYKATRNRLRSLGGSAKVHRERKPKPYFRRERW